jgi:hypothetical protein
MSTTSPFRRSTLAAGVPAPLALPTRQTRRGWVALGVLLVVGLGAAGAYLYQQAGAKTSLVQVVRQVPVGQELTREDLSTVAVAGDLTAISAANLDSVLGQSAAVALVPGTLLQRSMLSPDDSGLQAGQSQVGVAVTGAQIPADGLSPGDLVTVYQLPDASQRQLTARVLVQNATVTATHPDTVATGGTLLTLTVPQPAAGDVAAASGAGQIAVVRIKAEQ